MALDDGSGSGGGGGGIDLGGTATSMCAISPTDTISTFNNLMNRISNLEQIVSQITGANLNAGTLGDLSSQVGWVYGVEYMGIPGWIQTEYGTLIPPPGFTLSGSGFQMWNACTGEYVNYQGVVMDENGVLQFGFDTQGNMCGAKVQQWDDAAAGVSYQAFAFCSQTTSLENGLTVVTNELSTEFSGATIQVDRHGYYLVEASGTASSNTNPRTDYEYYIDVDNGAGSSLGRDRYGSTNLFLSRIVELSAGASISVTYGHTGSAAEAAYGKMFRAIRVLGL